MPRLIIRSSDIHAAGCFALENIPKGTRVLEYTGERISKEEGDRRYEGRPYTYLFALGKGDTVIDGHGMAMFINHSCDPNCETDEIKGHIYIQSIRDIAAGEELTYDYWLFDGDEDAPCYCGSEDCRGSMYSPEELRRQKRRAAKRERELATAQNHENPSHSLKGNGGESRKRSGSKLPLRERKTRTRK